MVFLDDLTKPLQSTDGAGKSMSTSSGDAEQRRHSKAKTTSTLFVAAIIIALMIMMTVVANMFRYEVILVPKQEYQNIVQYLVKDRWTGEIEAVWQGSNGQFRQTKRHFFDSSREQN